MSRVVFEWTKQKQYLKKKCKTIIRKMERGKLQWQVERVKGRSNKGWGLSKGLRGYVEIYKRVLRTRFPRGLPFSFLFFSFLYFTIFTILFISYFNFLHPGLIFIIRKERFCLFIFDGLIICSSFTLFNLI